MVLLEMESDLLIFMYLHDRWSTVSTLIILRILTSNICWDILAIYWQHKIPILCGSRFSKGTLLQELYSTSSKSFEKICSLLYSLRYSILTHPNELIP